MGGKTTNRRLQKWTKQKTKDIAQILSQNNELDSGEQIDGKSRNTDDKEMRLSSQIPGQEENQQAGDNYFETI